MHHRRDQGKNQKAAAGEKGRAAEGREVVEMKVALTLFAASVLQACTSQTLIYHDYRHAQQTIVPASMPGVKLDKVAVFQTPRYPGRLLVAPGRPSLMRVRTKYPTTEAWLAAIPTFESQFRGAAAEALRRKGHQGCSIGKFSPLPEKGALEFEYQCQSST
jgi:hypothetical protein